MNKDTKAQLKKLQLQNAALRHVLEKKTSRSMSQIADILAFDLEDKTHQKLCGAVTVSDIAIDNCINQNAMLDEYLGSGKTASQSVASDKAEDKPDYNSMTQQDKIKFIHDKGENAFAHLVHDAMKDN